MFEFFTLHRENETNRRRREKKNRRKIEIVITKKGLFLLDKIEPKLNDLELSNTNNLTENELQTLNILLEKLRQ